MSKIRKVLTWVCMLAALPLASTAFAQGGALRSVASDGGGMAVSVPEASTSVSPPFRGSSFEPSASTGRLSSSEMAKMLTYEAAVAPRGAVYSVIGSDNRILVNPTTVFPYRAIVLITFSAGRCSGWLIGPNTVVTAGHCVAPGNRNGWYPYTSYRIYPGHNGNTAPYGYCTAKALYTSAYWWSYAYDDYDYGAIKLNCSVGNTVGWFGLFASSNSLIDFVSFNSGYPGDKPLTQWRTTDYIRVTDARRLFYQNDTFGGNSGSPIWTYWRTCYPCVAAVHAYGVDEFSPPPYSNHNHGTRITKQVYDLLVYWKSK